jgi:type III pantothenate kinase
MTTPGAPERRGPEQYRVNLLVDLGNSRLKWALHEAGRWHADAASLETAGMAPLLDRVWGGMSAPRQVVVCSVSEPRRLQALEHWAQARWSLAPRVIRSRAEQLGVTNRYREPEQLGADRWAALIGARGLTSAAACVVDCGTAVTVDALSARGEFLGGVIFPGLRLLRDGLARGTTGVKTADGSDADCLARSTADGVAAGTLFGLAGAVERLVHEHRRRLGDTMQVLLTGGDAPRLAPRLSVAFTPVPDLVLKGLARIADTS